MESLEDIKIKAIIQDGNGGPEVLKLGEAPFPSNEGKPDYVWIKVEATAINRAETLQRKGNSLESLALFRGIPTNLR